MVPERLGALKQTRLSFARLLVEKMASEGWEISLERADLDADGVGRVVYAIETPSMRLSFGVFSRTSSDGEDTDRIIAQEWDLWAFLCEGEASPSLMDHQYEQLPKVMEGRAPPEVLIWTRANRSSRFFGHVVDSLAEGHQPDIEHLARGGYLMRSSGYYGNGLNGTRVFRALGEEHPLKRPYMSQMLAAYMLRVFGYDLAEHIAGERSSGAAELDPEIKRYLGTGNSSGVGIVLYVVNHPKQIHAWLRAREIALARTKATTPDPADVERFEELLARARRWFAEDESETNDFFRSKDRIAAGLARIGDELERLGGADEPDLWLELCAWATDELGAETQEVLNSLLIDVYPEAVEGLESSLTTSERTDLVPGMAVSTLRSLLRSAYGWAFEIDFDRPGATRHFWYRSIENEEPRLGIRGETGHEEYGRPIDIARQVQALESELAAADPGDSVAEFLFDHPDYRAIVERVQNVHDLAYAEIRGNPLDAEFVPLYFIACLKSFWGIQKAHPKSKGWVRGTFFQGAPLREGLAAGRTDYWMYPPKPDRDDYWKGRGGGA